MTKLTQLMQVNWWAISTLLTSTRILLQLSKVVKNCFTYWNYLQNNRNYTKETNILDFFSNKEELNGYHIILEFVIREGNIGQRLMRAEDFKKQMLKLQRKRSYSTECKSSDYRFKKNIGFWMPDAIL